jgi:hypothetical protein
VEKQMNPRSESFIAAWLALFLFGVYLLSFSGRLYSQDSMLMLSVTESFVKRGEFNTGQMWTLYKARNELGPDGESYSKTGYGTSLFAAPLYVLALAVPDLGLVQTTLLTSAIVIALTGALVFLTARRLKFSRGVSVVAALLFGLATPAWVYAKQFWSEPVSLFTLFAAFYFLLRFRNDSNRYDALLAGIALGLAVATRVTNAALVPFFTWYGFADKLRSVRGRGGLALFGTALTLFALSIAWYNWARYGSLLAAGYRADETFNNPILLGLYGLLFSPGKGLFVYVPFLAALPWSLGMLYRSARRETLLILPIFTIYLLIFSTWYYWWGGTNWSPRFLVPTLPFLVLAIAPAVELAANAASCNKTHTAFAAIFFALCLLSFAFEFLGISVPSLAYRLRMLRLSPNPEGDAIFLPQFSPLVGYFDLLRPKALDFAWISVADNTVSADWLVVTLTLAFIAFCGLALCIALRAERSTSQRHEEIVSSRRPFLTMTGLVLAIALSLFSLYRYRGDVRFGGSDGYRALLQAVQRDARPRDVLILNDDVLAPFFLNENRAGIRWYGMSRDPAQWDEATRALLARLSRQYTYVWFAFDDLTVSLSDPTRAWLEESLHPIAQYDFDDGVHLILFATEAPP